MALPTIGGVVSNRRNVFNLSVDDLAELCSIDKQTLVDIERGAVLPSLEQLEKLADVLLLGDNSKFFWTSVLSEANVENIRLRTVGQLIRCTREIKQKHLDQVADFIGISVSRVSDIELGREIPTCDEFEKLCLFLGIFGKNKEDYEWTFFDSVVDEAAKERLAYYDWLVSWY